jgi:hypothetical protein
LSIGALGAGEGGACWLAGPDSDACTDVALAKVISSTRGRLRVVLKCTPQLCDKFQPCELVHVVANERAQIADTKAVLARCAAGGISRTRNRREPGTLSADALVEWQYLVCVVTIPNVKLAVEEVLVDLMTSQRANRGLSKCLNKVSHRYHLT